MVNNNYDFKYGTLYNGSFDITWCWTNGTFILKCGEIQVWYNIRHNKPYTSDKNIEDIISEE